MVEEKVLHWTGGRGQPEASGMFQTELGCKGLERKGRGREGKTREKGEVN